MSFSDQNLSIVCRCGVVIVVVVNFSHFRLFLQNYRANFNQTWHIASLGEGDSNLFKWIKGPAFFQGEMIKNNEKSLTKLKNLLLQTTKPISTILDTMHPWVKGIQVCSNEWPNPFPRGDNYKIAKIHWCN